MRPQVVCIPGSVAPAAQRYRPLVEAAGEAADLHLKDLEVYRDDAPPAGYSIDEELDAIDRFADDRHLSRFHLLGYSAGGFISLAYAGTRPQRLLSLGLFEPARLPGELSEKELAFFSLLESRLKGLEGPEFMATFVRNQVKPGVQLAPPAGPPTPEMKKRPAGIAALIRSFEAYPFDRDRFRSVEFPVYYGYGDLSHEEQALKPGILAQLVGDIHVHRFPGVHHFVPPEEIYTREHVDALIAMWHAAETSAGSAVELSRK